jgi:hypothetical protein
MDFARVVLLWILLAGGLGACGGAGGGDGGTLSGATVETYEVVSANRWNVVESPHGTTGFISYSRTGSALGFATYDTGGAALSNFTGDLAIKLLAFPVVKGSSWTGQVNSNGFIVRANTVVLNDAVQVSVPAGAFTCVVTSTETVAPTGYDQTTGRHLVNLRRYFAPGVGLVKVEGAMSDGSSLAAELTSYSLVQPTATDLFPLEVGDRWTFRWTGV